MGDNSPIQSKKKNASTPSCLDAVGCFVFLLILGTMAVFGFSKYNTDEQERQEVGGQDRIENIVRVFMHKPTQYTFFVRENDQIVSQVVVSCNNIKIITDIPSNKPMWAVAAYSKHEAKVRANTPGYVRTDPPYMNVEIHIHSEKDVNGGGWEENHGKFGTETGTTDVLK